MLSDCDAGEDSWESLGQQGDQTSLKGNQLWILIKKTDGEAEVLIFWSPDVNSWLTGKDPDAGKDWEQKEKMSEDEMAGQHYQCSGHELGQTLGDGEDTEAWRAAVHEEVGYNLVTEQQQYRMHNQY